MPGILVDGVVLLLFSTQHLSGSADNFGDSVPCLRSVLKSISIPLHGVLEIAAIPVMWRFSDFGALEFCILQQIASANSATNDR
jgi:hypothetical protein